VKSNSSNVCYESSTSGNKAKLKGIGEYRRKIGRRSAKNVFVPRT